MNKKTTILITLSLLLALALTACSGNSTRSDTPADSNSAVDNASTDNQTPAEPSVDSGDEKPADEDDSAEPSLDEETTSKVSYSVDVFPILESRCTTCHGVARVEGGFILLTYNDLMTGGKSGPVIVAGDADNSYLVELIRGQKMPKRGPKLTPVQTQMIIDWVNQGAENN